MSALDGLYVNTCSYSLNLDIAPRGTVPLHARKGIVSQFLVCCYFINSYVPYSADQMSQNAIPYDHLTHRTV